MLFWKSAVTQAGRIFLQPSKTESSTGDDERFSIVAFLTNPNFAEVVCSNSFKSNLITNACGLLKEELRRLG